MTIGGKTVADIQIGGKTVQSIYDNTHSVLLWEKSSAEPDYFYFEDRSGAANSISMVSVYAGTMEEWLALEYSTDKQTWTSWDFTHTIPLAADGKVYFRGDNVKFSVSSGNYHSFASTGDIHAGGSVRSLFDKTVPASLNSQLTMFGWMFNGMSTLVSVDRDLFLGINYGSAGSWRDTTNLFYATFSNTSITTPPDLSEVHHVSGSTFRETFNQCRQLTSAAPMDVNDIEPSSANSFRSAYFQCYALTDATPMNISFSTAYNTTFNNTFTGCRLLVTPPDLSSITVLGNQSMYRTFYGCTALTSLKVGFTQWGSETSTDTNYRSNYQWTYNVNTSGVFYCPSTLTPTRNSADGTTTTDFIPYNWTITGPDGKLPAPEITVENGTVTITDAGGNPSVTIYYTTDGRDPRTYGTAYTQPFSMPATPSVKAVAVYNGSASVSDSDVSVYNNPSTVRGYKLVATNSIFDSSLSDDLHYMLAGVDNGAYYLMHNSGWTNPSGSTAYYDNGQPVSVLSYTDSSNNTVRYIPADSITVSDYEFVCTRVTRAGYTNHVYLHKNSAAYLGQNNDESPNVCTALKPNVSSVAVAQGGGMWRYESDGPVWNGKVSLKLYATGLLEYGIGNSDYYSAGKRFYLNLEAQAEPLGTVVVFKATSETIG